MSFLIPIFDFQHALTWGLFYTALTFALTYIGTQKSMRDCELESGRWPLMFAAGGGALAFLLTVAYLAGCQFTPEVIPGDWGRFLRLPYHLSLFILLLMISATDLKSYYILEWTCWLGILIGVCAATTSGELQLAHVWVDWNQEVRHVRGPYLPAWMSAHPHLHGFTWSMAGMACGVALSAGVRWISSAILQMRTLGSGDIYLMAMIGAYLGWQPTLVAFLLAPLFALLIGGTLKLISNRPALPYGPFLALGAMAVLFSWRDLWMLEFQLTKGAHVDREHIFAFRRFMGDPVALLAIIVIATTLFLALLGLLRLYHSLPIESRTAAAEGISDSPITVDSPDSSQITTGPNSSENS